MKKANGKSLIDILIKAGDRADGRKARGRRHSLAGILILITLGYLCGQTSIRGMVNFFNPVSAFEESDGSSRVDSQARDSARESMDPEERKRWAGDRKKWMKRADAEAKKILKQLQKIYPFRSIPDHSTITRSLSKADAEEIIVGLFEFFSSMVPEGERRHIAIDGKALRAALNRSLTNHSLYILNVYDVAARIFITSIKVGDKKNEASTLLDDEIKNILLGRPSIVTMDAAGTQQELIRLMVKLGSNYVLPVKGNQKNLEKLITAFFTEQAFSQTEQVQSTVDLNGHSEEEGASEVITPGEIHFTKEANENTTEDYTSLDNEQKEMENGKPESVELDKADEEPGSQNQDATEEQPEESAACDCREQPDDGEEQPENEPKPDSEEHVPAPEVNEADSIDSGLTSNEKPHVECEVFPWVGKFIPYEMAASNLDPQNRGLVYVRFGTGYILMARNGERFERTEYLVIQNPSILAERIFQERFESVKSVVMVTRFRLEEKYSRELGRHWALVVNSVPYISDRLLTPEEAKELIGGHWRVEVAHHMLDVNMDEDRSTTRSNDAPWTLSSLRKAAQNLINNVGGKWAATSTTPINCTDASCEVRKCLKNNLAMAMEYISTPMGIAVDCF